MLRREFTAASRRALSALRGANWRSFAPPGGDAALALPGTCPSKGVPFQRAAEVPFQRAAGRRAAPIAFTLPRDVGQRRRAAGALPPFFTGLLPEGRRLSAIRRAAKTSADDELTLLLAVGADTVGDVQIFAAGVQPDPDGAVPPNAPTLEEADFREVFERAITPSSLDRAALAGVQDKVSGGAISLPVSHSGAAWILKLDPHEYPGVVENEAFFLAAARHSGLEVAEAEIVRDRFGVPGRQDT